MFCNLAFFLFVGLCTQFSKSLFRFVNLFLILEPVWWARNVVFWSDATVADLQVLVYRDNFCACQYWNHQKYYLYWLSLKHEAVLFLLVWIAGWKKKENRGRGWLWTSWKKNPWTWKRWKRKLRSKSSGNFSTKLKWLWSTWIWNCATTRAQFCYNIMGRAKVIVEMLMLKDKGWNNFVRFLPKVPDDWKGKFRFSNKK